MASSSSQGDEIESVGEREPLLPGRVPAVETRRPGYERRRQQPPRGSFIDTDHGTYLSLRQEITNVPPMDNPTTLALQVCNDKVLKPYKRLLLIVGWQPMFDSPTACWQQVFNIIHPLIVICFVLIGYVIQYAACFRRDGADYNSRKPLTPIGTNRTNGSNLHPVCEPFIISQYIIPDVLHSLAYMYSFYLLRISQREQMPVLMERVFLHTSPTHSGFLSQGKLICTMRTLLIMGICWVLLSFTAQILHAVGMYDTINFTFLAPQFISMTGRIVLLILMLLGFLALDVVYTAVVINYCVQCVLLIFYIEGLQEKLRQKLLDLTRAIKEISSIESHLGSLNYTTALAMSLVLFNFGTMALLGAVEFLTPQKIRSTMMYASSGLSVVFWCSMMALPIIQAARLSAACNSLRKIGHVLRIKPFVYQSTPNEELDSFLLYVSSLYLSAKIFLIPVKTSYISFAVVSVCFIMLLLFQTGVIKVWLN